MRNIIADMASVISFYRFLIFQIKEKGFEVDKILNEEHIGAIKDECEYLKILLERED